MAGLASELVNFRNIKNGIPQFNKPLFNRALVNNVAHVRSIGVVQGGAADLGELEAVNVRHIQSNVVVNSLGVFFQIGPVLVLALFALLDTRVVFEVLEKTGAEYDIKNYEQGQAHVRVHQA